MIDALPILTQGLGNIHAGTACAMSAVSFLEGGSGQTDTPECVHPILARVFVRVNDWPGWESDEQRTRTLWPLIVRAMGTRPPANEQEAKRLAVRLAVFSARHVLPLVREQDRAVCERAIVAAEGWCEGTVSEQECKTAAAAYAGAYAYAAAGAYAAAAAYAAAYAYAAYAYAGAAAAAAAAYAYAAADAYAADDPVGFLTALLDEHQRLTDTRATVTTDTPRATVTTDQIIALTAHVPALPS